MLPIQSLLGVCAIVAIAWGLSERRDEVRWRSIALGLGLQFVLAVLLIKIPVMRDAFGVLNGAVVALNNATRAGTAFAFGYVGGADAPFAFSGTGSTFILAFQSLPLILIISALSALLFHWNVIPPVVRAFAWVLRRTVGVDGPAGVATTMNIFVGMVEAPLVIRPYLVAESRSGLFVIMTAGMAMVAGTVMVLYATMLHGVIPNPLGQLLTASILAAPATVVVAFLMVPEDPALRAAGQDATAIILTRHPGDNMMSVISRGTVDGAQLIINIIAMLIVLVALVSLANTVIGHLPDVYGAPLTLQRMLGWVLAPLAWLIGIPWSEAPAAGALLGTKTVLNELIAYTDLSHLGPEVLSVRSRLIMTYALCGFANFGSLGIMIGGMGAMVPERRAEIVALAPKTLVSGTLATCLSGAMVGLLTWT
ncbi:MAG: nucleoside:proton symporter [Rhodospirillaceae bacterium]|nr:MAG: nucleoside:proton symporter [Rhodospirillaceae bacterium]